MRNDLDKDLCEGCAEIKPQGLIQTINHSCASNRYTYHVGLVTMRMLNDLFSQHDPLHSFRKLLDFPHFKKMEITEATTVYDKIFYSAERDLEIKWMKRLREYITLEEEFNSKY